MVRRYSATYDSEQATAAHAAFSGDAALGGWGEAGPGDGYGHTFATWAIRVNARELDVQYSLGHSSPMMVRRYSAT